MKIGIDARFFGGEQSKGLGRYTEKLIEHALTMDNKNEYVIFLQSDGIERWNSHEQFSKHTNVTLIEAPYRWYTLSEQIFMPWLIIRSGVDFMHFPHFNVPLLYFGNFIVTIHDLIISRFPTERATTLAPLTYWFKQLAYNRVIKHAAKWAKSIITVSEYSKQDIVDLLHVPAERIHVTYEAVDAFPVNDAQSPESVLARYDIGKPYLLYVGNAYPHKNLETLLEAMAKRKKQGLEDIQLVLVGKQDYFYEHIKQQAWALYVDDLITFTGFVPDADLPILYNQALAYVFPSKYEGFGLPPLEAMRYGTPVISSNSSCLPEVLGDAALYFDFQDVDAILSHVSTLQNEAEREQRIARGTAQVGKYSWQEMAKETLAIYESTFDTLDGKS